LLDGYNNTCNRIKTTMALGIWMCSIKLNAKRYTGNKKKEN